MAEIRGSMDGMVPASFPDQPWKTWSRDEIYDGTYGKDHYIPKVNDHVIEPLTGNLYVVTDIDTEGISSLRQIAIRVPSSFEDIFSETSDNYRIYQDTNVDPVTLSVDGMMRVFSSRAKYAIIYRGSSSDASDAISEYFDSSGHSQGPGIPLELVAISDANNYAIKSIRTCNLNSTTLPLDDGETCTIVVYTDDGKVVSSTQALIENTTFIKQAFAEQKYLVNIYLESPLISFSDDTLISFPLNLNVASFKPLLVRVYNDGSVKKDPIDGGKFALLGIDSYSPGVPGEHPLVLRYTMDPDEAGITTIGTINGNYITRPYRITTRDPDGLYDVKLYLAPLFNGTNYDYRVHMTNLDRTLSLDVTNYVTVSGLSFPRGPTSGFVQVDLILNLSDVSPLFKSYTHTERCHVKINDLPTSNTSNIWEVRYDSSPTKPSYGENLRATRNGSDPRRVNISNNYNSWQDFKANTYERTNPLYGPHETEPLEPTYIRVRHGNNSVVNGVTLFKNDFHMGDVVPQYDNVIVEFLVSAAGGYLVLSTVEMTVR